MFRNKMVSRFSFRWRDRFLLIGVSTCVLVIAFTSPVFAQLFSFGESFNSTSTLLPVGVNRYGSLEVTWVNSVLTGDELFQIAAPAVIDRSDLSQMQQSVEVRAKNIENLIWVETQKYRELALAHLFNPDANPDPLPSGKIITSTLRNLPVVQGDTGIGRSLTIATVTSYDADFYGKTPKEVAKQWQTALQSEASIIEGLFSPSSLRQRIEETIGILLGLIVLTIVLSSSRWWLGKRRRALKDKLAVEATEDAIAETVMEQTQTSSSRVEQVRSDKCNAERAEEDNDGQHQDASNSERTRLICESQLKKQLSQLRRLDLYKSAQWILLWTIILSWYGGSYLISTRLPSLMRWSGKVLMQPLSLIVIWFLVSLAIRISGFLIQRSLRTWTETSYLSFGDTQRKMVRSQTISGALQGFATFGFIIIGILLTLIEFGLSPTSIFAGSAIVGFAFSFGSQSLVKDLVNGCLILVEDQFAVGDIIDANGESGVVERLNLRLTQLRNLDGELISIPNSLITLVKNKSNGWAQVNLGIDVAYDTDLDYAIAIIEEVATKMSQDSKWKSLILEPPDVLGVDAFNDSSITIRLTMRTAPAQQWVVARELRRLLKQALDKAQISIPFPQRSVWFENGLPVANTTANARDAIELQK